MGICELNNVMYVNTPHGISQVLFIMDYGIHQNTIWVCANIENGNIRHYNSNQITVCVNYTLDFNTQKKTKIMKEVKERKPKEKLHSNRIRIILEELEMSQAELADIALDGDSAHLSRIINGQRRSISLPIAIKIATALQRPVEEVFIYKQKDETKKQQG
jgi:DNA-binding XRE family transcriptional regulator